jgi:hypothetical protein
MPSGFPKAFPFITHATCPDYFLSLDVTVIIIPEA